MPFDIRLIFFELHYKKNSINARQLIREHDVNTRKVVKKKGFRFTLYPVINMLLITSKTSRDEGNYFCFTSGIVKYQHVGADT